MSSRNVSPSEALMTCNFKCAQKLGFSYVWMHSLLLWDCIITHGWFLLQCPGIVCMYYSVWKINVADSFIEFFSVGCRNTSKRLLFCLRSIKHNFHSTWETYWQKQTQAMFNLQRSHDWLKTCLIASYDEVVKSCSLCRYAQNLNGHLRS